MNPVPTVRRIKTTHRLRIQRQILLMRQNQTRTSKPIIAKEKIRRRRATSGSGTFTVDRCH